MKSDRRDFLKKAGLSAGLLLTGLGESEVKACMQFVREDYEASVEKSKSRKQIFNMCGYAAPKIPVVRIGYVGIGSRGGGAVTRMLKIKGLKINALCDIREKAVKANNKKLVDKGLQPAAEYFGNEYSWKGLCERDDIDLVYIRH